MALTLHKAGYDHAVSLVKRGLEVVHDPQVWLDARPDQNDIARYLDTHSPAEYGLWFLGIDTAHKNGSVDMHKDNFRYTYGDFSMLHVGALRDIVQQAAQHPDIKDAAQKLLDMIKNHKK